MLNIGVDTETLAGEPITFQFYSAELGMDKILWLKSGADATRSFFNFLDSLNLRDGKMAVLWGHNLEFDMISFFYDRYKMLTDESIEGNFYGWDTHIVYAHVKFARFRKGKKTVMLIDTFAYFTTSLAKLADMVCPELPKLEPPPGLGSRRYSASNKKFVEYAMRDALIAYRAGVEIHKMHNELDIPLCVSAPHFASKVFRRKFLKLPIPLPPRSIVYSAMHSYHGGKNNVTATAGFYRGVRAVDIRSAYPFAMAGFPSFSNPKLYKTIRGSGTPKRLPPFAIYKIDGTAADCPYPSLYNHSFKPLVGDFSGQWVTGFELNEALARGEVRLMRTEGYYYDAEKDNEPSPFAEYVTHWFNKKEKPEDKIHRECYKLLLNSLYGKFIQTRSNAIMSDLVFDLDDNKLVDAAEIIAGGLFNPFIATLITGHTRAYIHRLEHDYKALHTSTDGVFTQKKPRLSQGLGGLSVEASGDLLLLRNKLYIFYAPISSIPKGKQYTASTIHPKLAITKYALHGFHGTLSQLEQIWVSGNREYEYIKVNKLRESIRRNLTVNKFEPRRATLNF